MNSASQKTPTNVPNRAMPVALPSEPPFTPSGNWAALQKTLPAQPSKKRKRTMPITANPAPIKPHTPKLSRTLTTYNPWNPNASNPRRNGNQSLIQRTNSSDKFKFFIRFESLLMTELVATSALIVRWLELVQMAQMTY